VWGVYPYFWSGKVIAGDMQNGLYVFTFDSLRARTPVRLLSPADQTVSSGADPLSFRWTRVADPVGDPHKYFLEIRGSGLDTLIGTGTDTSYTIANSSILPPGAFSWWVVTKDEVAMIASRDTLSFTRTATTDVRVSDAPAKFALGQNYPNPFNPATSIRFDLPEAGIVTLMVYNILDQEVATLLDHQRQEAGSHAAGFLAESLPSGVYLYRISVESGSKKFTSMRKMVLVR